MQVLVVVPVRVMMMFSECFIFPYLEHLLRSVSTILYFVMYSLPGDYRYLAGAHNEIVVKEVKSQVGQHVSRELEMAQYAAQVLLKANVWRFQLGFSLRWTHDLHCSSIVLVF